MTVGQHLPAEVAREIGGLALSCVRSDNPMTTLRAVQWRNSLARVGLPIPLWVVHDVGLLAVLDPATVPMGPRPGLGRTGYPAQLEELLGKWTETLHEVAHSEVMERAREWRLRDDLLAVMWLRVLGPMHELRGREPGNTQPPMLPLDPDIYRDLEPQLPELFAATERGTDIRFLQHLVEQRLRLIAAIEQIDLDTLRLLGMFGAEASAANAMEMMDLLGVFDSPEATDVVSFSLDLLPSVLETRRQAGQQVFSVDGYAGIERSGTLDSLVMSELAFDEEMFARRYVENEVFYYAREKRHEEERRLHYIAIDATASMRGQRATFARGLALALVKKLLLRGEEVYVCFFDSRLYDAMHAVGRVRNAGGGINVPYVLSFRGERGRNYPKVMGLLANELHKLCRRERRTPILYLLTHAECHLPVETVERLRAVARLYGIFMLPSSGELDLDYVHRLHTIQVVGSDVLQQRESRARRALDIVDDATRGMTRRAASYPTGQMR